MTVGRREFLSAACIGLTGYTRALNGADNVLIHAMKAARFALGFINGPALYIYNIDTLAFQKLWLGDCELAAASFDRTGTLIVGSNSRTLPAIAALLRGDPEGSVVVANTCGAVQRRSLARVDALETALSPDGKKYAYYGRDFDTSERGIQFGAFEDRSTVVIEKYREEEFLIETTVVNTTLSWDPDSIRLVYNRNGKIFVFDTKSGLRHEVADGTNPTWEPSGDRIAFRSESGTLRIVDRTGARIKSRIEGQPILHSVHWSPDGKLVMFGRPNSRTSLDDPACGASTELVVANPATGESVVVHRPCHGLTDRIFGWLRFPLPCAVLK